MSNTERLALQGAIAVRERQIKSLTINIKGAAHLIKQALAPYHLMHLEELDADQIQANCETLTSSLRDLQQLTAELKELKAEV